MDELPDTNDARKPYRASTFKTFRRACMRRLVHLTDMRHALFMKHAKAVYTKRETANELRKVLEGYDAAIKAEAAFLEYCSGKENDNG